MREKNSERKTLISKAGALQLRRSRRSLRRARVFRNNDDDKDNGRDVWSIMNLFLMQNPNIKVFYY